MKYIILFELLSLLMLISGKDIKLENQSSISVYLGNIKHKIHLLVDPMSTMTYIFESKIPKQVLSTLLKTGEKKNITTTYGQFIGDYIIGTFTLGDDPNFSFKLGFILVSTTTSPLNKTYDGIIGLGFDHKAQYSIFNQASLRPMMKLNLKQGTISLGEISKMTTYCSPLFHIKKSKKDLSILLFDLNSIKSSETSIGHPIKGKGKLDLWKANYIIAPFNKEKQLFFGYFNETTNGGLIYTDESSSNEYKNYFFPLSYNQNQKLKSFLEIENKTHGFPSWYNEGNNNIPYSTIKLQIENGNEDWMIGAKVLGYDTIEFDYESNVIYGNNQKYPISWAYIITGIVGIISICLVLFFIKKNRKLDNKTKKVEETELIDKRKENTPNNS